MSLPETTRPARVLGFCGTGWRPSKPRLLVETIAAGLQHQHGLEVEIVDLLDFGPGLASFTRDGLDDRARELVERIEAAEGLVIGCPVFQGAYPGLFKHVFDLIGPQALKHRPVLLSAAGGGLRHSLVIEHQLRPLFGFFEAITMPTAVYAGAVDFGEDGLAAPVRARIADATQQFATQLGLCASRAA
jgi:FMN reductase